MENCLSNPEFSLDNPILTERANIIATGNPTVDTPTVRKADYVDLQDALNRISIMEDGASEAKLGKNQYNIEKQEFILRDGSVPMTGDLTLARDATQPLHAVTYSQLLAVEALINNINTRLTNIENTLANGLNERVTLKNLSAIDLNNGIVVGAIT